MFTIEEKSSEKPVGWATLRTRSYTRRMTDADVGLALGEKRAWNEGYGTETVRLLLREVFEQLNLHRAGWWTFGENIASLKLAAEMGFKEEGRLRDATFFDNRSTTVVVLGLLKDEYKPLRGE